MYSPSSPPRWLMAVLMLCLTALLTGVLTRPELFGLPAAAVVSVPTATSAPTAAPTPTVTPTPVPTPTATVAPTATPSSAPQPTPEAKAPVPSPGMEEVSQEEPPSTPPAPLECDQLVPVGDPVDPDDWFADAAFIGDSRTDGFYLYSGVTSEADFFFSTGLTVYDVVNEKAVIRRGDRKVSVLEALGEETYGKVYLSLGINELGYLDAQSYAETYGQLIDSLREAQPGALLYVQSITPVNTELCKSHNIPSYVTNEQIAAYNEALAGLCEDKQVPLIDLSEPFVGDDGQVLAELSADGVHFKKAGYALWLDYLTTHTGT